MNSRFLVSASKRRLLNGAINRRAVQANAATARMNGSVNGAVRPFHASVASADALDMADTFARRHSKFCPRNLNLRCLLKPLPFIVFEMQNNLFRRYDGRSWTHYLRLNYHENNANQHQFTVPLLLSFFEIIPAIQWVHEVKNQRRCFKLLVSKTSMNL